MIILESTNKTIAKSKKDIKTFCKGFDIYYSIGGLPLYTKGKKEAFYKMLTKNSDGLSIGSNDYKLTKDLDDSIIYVDRI